MNPNRHNLFHYAIIILLMLAPLRGVMAAHCDMGEMSADADHVAMMAKHEMMGHDMSAMMAVADKMDMNEANCCDDVASNCATACDFGVSISLTLQETSFTSVYGNSINLVFVSSKTLFRELTPPARPPAKLS